MSLLKSAGKIAAAGIGGGGVTEIGQQAAAGQSDPRSGLCGVCTGKADHEEVVASLPANRE